VPIYRIEIKKSAEKEINTLPLDIVERVLQLLDQLSIDPRPSSVKKLRGQKNMYRMRIGDYRVIYNIEDKILHILVLKAGHRKDVYK